MTDIDERITEIGWRETVLDGEQCFVSDPLPNKRVAIVRRTGIMTYVPQSRDEAGKVMSASVSEQLLAIAKERALELAGS